MAGNHLCFGRNLSNKLRQRSCGGTRWDKEYFDPRYFSGLPGVAYSLVYNIRHFGHVAEKRNEHYLDMKLFVAACLLLKGLMSESRMSALGDTYVDIQEVTDPRLFYSLSNID